MRLKKSIKVISLILLITVLLTAGCAEQPSEQSTEQPNEPIESTDVPNETEQVDAVQLSLEPNQSASVIIDDTPSITSENIEKVPLLQIASVTPDDYGINIKVKNIGNAVAEDVYCGVIVFGASNKIAFPEYITAEKFRDIILPAIREGVTGNTYDYDTGYHYKDTPNLTISYRLIGINYVGEIEPGKAGSSDIDIVNSGTSRSEYLKVAWMAGDEEELVMY